MVSRADENRRYDAISTESTTIRMKEHHHVRSSLGRPKSLGRSQLRRQTSRRPPLRFRPSGRPRLRRLIRAVDEPLGELRPRFHVPLTARRRLLAAGSGPVDRRAAVDLVDRHRRLRAAACGSRLRRGRLPIPHRRRDLPVGQASVEQAVRMDGRVGLHLRAHRHDHLGGGVRGGIPRESLWARTQPQHHPRPCSDVARAGAGHQLLGHEVAGPHRTHRALRRTHRSHRARTVPADLRTQAQLLHLLRHHGHRRRRQLPTRVPGRRGRRTLPLLRLRSLRRCRRGSVESSPRRPQGDAHDDLRRSGLGPVLLRRLRARRPESRGDRRR